MPAKPSLRPSTPPPAADIVTGPSRGSVLRLLRPSKPPDLDTSRYPRKQPLRGVRTALLVCWSVVLGYLGNGLYNIWQLVHADASRLTDWKALANALLLPGFVATSSIPPWIYAVSGCAFLAFALGTGWATIDERTEVIVLREREVKDGVRKYLPGILSEIGIEEAATRPAGPPFDEALLPAPEHLVARTEDVEWVVEQLRPRDGEGIAALDGLAGIGKTAVAAVATDRLRGLGCFLDGIVVAPCRGVIDASATLHYILTRFHPYRQAPATYELVGLAEIAQSLLTNKQALVVLDNVEPELGVADIVGCLRSAGIAVLITSRHVLPQTVVPAAQRRRLGLLTLNDALSLFAQYAGRASSDDLTNPERAAAVRIVEALGRHTLAVTLAAGNVAESGRDINAMATELGDPERGLDLTEEKAEATIRQAFEQSYKSLGSREQKLFAGLAAFSADEFGRNAAIALARGLRADTPELSVRRLVRRAMLNADLDITMQEGDRERLIIHPLLRAFATDKFHRWNQRQQLSARRAIVRYYASYAEEVNTGALGKDEENISHALEDAIALHLGEQTIILFLYLQYLLMARGRAVMRQQAYDAVVRAAERAGKYRNRRAHWVTLAMVGLLCTQAASSRGQYEEANRYLQGAEAAARRARSPWLQALIIAIRASISRSQGNLPEAERYALQSWATMQKANDAEPWIQGIVLLQLAFVTALLRGGEAARSYYETARPLLATLSSVEFNLSEDFVLFMQGFAAQGSGQLAEATAYFEEALSIASTVGNRQIEISALTRLGHISRDQGRLDEAAKLYGQAANLRDAISSPALFHTVGDALLGLARVARESDKLDEAVGYFQQAYDILSTIPGQPHLGEIFSELGEIAFQRKDLEKAEAYFQNALTLRRAQDDRRREAVVLSWLGFVAQQRDQLPEASAYHRDALSTWRDLRDRQEEAKSLVRLGELALQQGQLEEAEKYYRDALKIRRDLLDRRGEGIALAWLGEIAKRRGHLGQAAAYHQQALAIWREIRDQVEEKKTLDHLRAIARHIGSDGVPEG